METSCKTCIHKKVCDLWRKEECQSARSFFDDECELYSEVPHWIPATEDVPHIKEGCAGAVVVNAVYWEIGKYISMPLRYVRKKIRNKLVERWEYMDGSIIHKSVLYWMPLPEPPKGEDDDR